MKRQCYQRDINLKKEKKRVERSYKCSMGKNIVNRVVFPKRSTGLRSDLFKMRIYFFENKLFFIICTTTGRFCFYYIFYVYLLSQIHILGFLKPHYFIHKLKLFLVTPFGFQKVKSFTKTIISYFQNSWMILSNWFGSA